MDLRDKEKQLVQTFRQEIEAIDRDLIMRFYKSLIILGIVSMFFHKQLTMQSSIIAGVVVFLYVCYINHMDNKYVSDLYSDLEDAIKSDTLSAYYIQDRNFFESMVYYKRRFHDDSKPIPSHSKERRFTTPLNLILLVSLILASVFLVNFAKQIADDQAKFVLFVNLGFVLITAAFAVIIFLSVRFPKK